MGFDFPSLAELRAIGRRYFGSRPQEASPQEAPPSNVHLRDLLETPFQNINDAHERLGELETRLRGQSDRRSVFLTVYVRMTHAVSEAIDAGHFSDENWIRNYTVTFADYYRRALLAFERGQSAPVPRAWQIGFSVSLSGRTIILQDALLGINAHINYDLAYTVSDVGIDPDRPAKRRDHDAINAILRRLIDDTQRVLAEIYPNEAIAALDDLLGRGDEAIALLALVGSRDLAWRNAVHLTDTSFPPIRSLVR